MPVTELAINSGEALRPNWLIDTDAQGRPRLRHSCSLVAGHRQR